MVSHPDILNLVIDDCEKRIIIHKALCGLLKEFPLASSATTVYKPGYSQGEGWKDPIAIIERELQKAQRAGNYLIASIQKEAMPLFLNEFEGISHNVLITQGEEGGVMPSGYNQMLDLNAIDEETIAYIIAYSFKQRIQASGCSISGSCP